MPTNAGAYLVSEKKHPFEVKDAPYPTPSDDEIVIQNKALAINPVDWKVQRDAIIPVQYPTILGCDVAGVVAEVGPSVTNFQKGDRVTAHAHNLGSGGEPEHGAYQLYTLHNHKLVAPIPSSLSFEQAAVLPLAISTAAAGLYEKDWLNMQRPSLNPKPTGETILVWGGSGAMGSMTIQLAKASGYEVVTTASKRNFDYVKSLGADQVFDYNFKTIEDDLVDHLKGKTLVGAYDAIGDASTTMACANVLARSKGRKFVASVYVPPETLPDGVTSKFLFALSILHNDISKSVWGDYVPEALKQGKLQAKPDPMIVGKGLGDVQKACDRLAEGVSAAKVVVSI